jgi:hypothetical protein
MHNLFVSVPSARGVHPSTMWNVVEMAKKLPKDGIEVHGASPYRMPLDLVRNELATAFLSTTCDLNLLQDDDVQVDVAWLPKMVAALDAGAEIISAPCRLRDHAHGGAQADIAFNVKPIAGPFTIGGLRVYECDLTGLGAVLVTRKVVEALYAAEPEKYAGRLQPGSKSAPIFKSEVVAANVLVEEADSTLIYALDDMVFSRKVRALGFKIHAAIDVPTVHEGMAGIFAEEMVRRMRAAAPPRPPAPMFLGADGKPMQRPA